MADPNKELYKALYNFTGQEGEMNLVKGETVEVKEKDPNGKQCGSSRVDSLIIADYAGSSGWWLVVKNGGEGWAPSN
jgi:myosin-1